MEPEAPGPHDMLAALASTEALRTCVAEHGAASLDARMALMDRARALLQHLLHRLLDADPACLLAPSAELRGLGLLRYAFCAALADRFDGGEPEDLAGRLPGIEPVLRALEALYPQLPGDFAEASGEHEDGAARRRLRAYAKVCAVALEAGEAVASRIGLGPRAAPVRLAVTAEDIAAHLDGEDSAELRHWSVRLFGRESERFLALIEADQVAGLARFMRLGILAGALFQEGSRDLDPFSELTDATLAEGLSLALDLRWLEEMTLANTRSYLSEVEGLSGADLLERLGPIFVVFATYGALGVRKASGEA